MHLRRALLAASTLLAAALAACSDPTLGRPSAAPSTARAADARDGDHGRRDGEHAEARLHRDYGPASSIGNGTVRTYVVTDPARHWAPVEVGVVMSEGAMEGLPAPVASTDPMANMHMYLLDLPQRNPTPYQFVQFDWNPAGHEPEGVYTVPHFDFHFYTVSKETRASIVPSDPQYAQKAASFPAPEFRAPFYIDAATAAGAPPAAVTVPQMGLHWLDVRSPELQGMAGHPENYRPFTKTFIYGSWNGQFIFDEPMITRAYIAAKKDASDEAVRDEVISVPTAARYAPAGFYPGAYRITWDPAAREYRIALTQLAWRD